MSLSRPIANAAWRTGKKLDDAYQHTYWDRLQELKYDFLHADLKESVGNALLFTLSIPGVHTAIVGTANSSRWLENAKLIEQGTLPKELFEAIRSRWLETAKTDWTGQ